MSVYTPGTASVTLGTQTVKAPALHRVITDVLTGVATRRILFVGDSRLAGATTSLGPNTAGIFPVMAQQLQAFIPTAQRGIYIPVSLADSRITVGAGWQYGGGLTPQFGWAPGTGSNQGAYYQGNAATGTLTFSASGINCDTFDVFFLAAASGFGTASANIDGGAGTALPVNGGVAVGKTTVSAAAATTHVCNIVNTATGLIGCTILGVEPRLSTATQLLLGQAGVNGASTKAWTTAAQSNPGVWDSAHIINVYNPDLVVWNLTGINEVLVSLQTPAQMIANLTTLITGTVGFAKSLILTEVAMASSSGAISSYVGAVLGFAAANNMPVIDQYNAWGGENAYPTLNPAPASMYGDVVHPNAAGYADQGRLPAQAIMGLTGF